MLIKKAIIILLLLLYLNQNLKVEISKTMSKCSGSTIFELRLDESDIGCCVGVSDDICWKFFVYLGKVTKHE